MWLLPAVLAACTAASAAPPAGDLSASIRLPQDREAEGLLSEAQGAAGRGDFAQAAALLQQVLEGGAERFVAIDGSHRNARDEANRRIAAFPGEGRAAYERHSGNAARVALDEALRSGDSAAPLEVAARYRQTRAGSDALRRLAERDMDSGRFPEAALAWQALIEQSGDAEGTARRDPQAVVAWCAALLLAGETDAARQIADRFQPALEGRTVGAGGRSAREQIAGLMNSPAFRNPAPPDSSRASHSERPEALLPTAGTPAWEFATWPPAVEPDALERHLTRLGESGVAPVSYGRPVATTGGIVARTVDAVVCLDVTSGELSWRYAADVSDLTPAPGISPSDRLLERWLGDAPLSAVTCDAERVYLLMPHVPRRTQGEPAPPPEVQSATPRRLIALNAQDGRPAWELAPDSVSLDATLDAIAAPLILHGPPTPHRGELYLLAEQGEALHLMVLDPQSGGLRWTVRLGHVDRGLGRDDRRLAQFCAVAVQGGTAYCPTGGGALIAVDLLTRRVRWGVRYPREPVRSQDPESLHGSLAPRQVLWGNGWTDLFVAATDDRVLLASPESESLWAFEVETGALAWWQARGAGQYVAGVFDDVVVVVGRSAIIGLRAGDGESLWTTAIDEPAGRGFATATHYVLPLLRGGVAAVAIAGGDTVRTYPRGGPPPLLEWPDDAAGVAAWRPRHLTWADGGVIEQSVDGVRRLKGLEAELDRARHAAAAGDPPSASQLADAASLAREAGSFTEAVGFAEQCRQSLSGADAEAARRDLLDLVFWSWGEPEQDANRISRAESLATSSREKLLTAYCAWRQVPATARQEDVARSFALLDGFNEPCFAVLDGGARRVRLDRLVASRWWSASRGLNEQEKTDFDRAIDAELAVRLNGQGALAKAEWAERLALLTQGKRLQLGLAPQWSSVRGFVQRQLRLQALTGDEDRAVAASALQQLALLFESHQDFDDAARAYRRLRDDFADVRLPEGAAVADVLDRLPAGSPTRRRMQGELPPVWPMRSPRVSVRPWPEGAIYFIPVRVEAERGGLFDRLNVAVDRLGGTVRFSGAGFHRPWALQLPRSNSLLRSAQMAPDLRRAWGFGQMLVLQVGADVFGIAPFDAAGEPGATLLWPPPGARVSATDAALVRESVVQTIAPRRRLAVSDAGRERTDHLGQLVGQVGPVRAGYFCVLERGMLVARDTSTGEELWRRSGVPGTARCMGDDHRIVVADFYHDELHVLDALDGRLVRSGPAGYTEDQVLQTEGTGVLREEVDATEAGGSAGLRIERVDIALGITVWDAAYPPGAVCFPIDQELCGVLAPGGLLRLVRLVDGTELASHSVDVPATVTRIVRLCDADSLFVVISGPRTDAALEAATPAAGLHTNEGHRRAIVNGTWHAFDRSTGALRWSRPLDNASLLLDQAFDVPILICNEHTYPPDRIGQGVPVQRIRCFDKRSGELVYEGFHDARHNYFIVERDAAAGWVELRLPGEVVRFDYSAAAP